MTVPTKEAQRAEALHGPLVPLPTETFSRSGTNREKVAAGIRLVLAECAAKADEHGVTDLVFGDGSPAPAGVDQDRHRLNQEVERHMERHGCDIGTALRAVSGETPARAGIDGDREALNQRVEARMAASGCSISEAIRAEEGS